MVRSSMSGNVIVLGYFDGVHIGHAKLLETAAKISSESGGRVVVRTFSDDRPDALSPGNLRRDLLIRFGADSVITDAFSDVKDMTPVEFVGIAANPNDRVVCGYDYRFGKNRFGNAASLIELLGQERIYVVPPVCLNGERISSSHIRKLITCGDMAAAVEMLGHPYIIRGKVVHGKHIGHTIGFPTANVKLSGVEPLPGAYCGYCQIGRRVYPSVTGVTACPTTGGYEPHAETHIIGFDGNLYGKTLDFMITDRLREERRFNTIAELSEQLAKDCAASRVIFDSQKNIFKLNNRRHQ